MKTFIKFFALCSILLSGIFAPQILSAQNADSIVRSRALDSLLQWHAVDTALHARPITYREFLQTVIANNLDYAVQKYNISIAQAQILVAKVYPDPSVSVGLSKDITTGFSTADSLGGNTYSVSASQTILLGGKIGAGVHVAEENKSVAEAQTEEFFWTLRANATQAYEAADIADSNYAANLRTYRNLAQLAQVNEHRVGAGDLGKVDFIQSRVDAIQARGAVLQADAARRAAFIALSQLMGRRNSDTLYRPARSLVLPKHTFNLDTLIARAKENRSDLIAARHQSESARLGIDLAHALRWPDLTVGLGYTTIAGTPVNPGPFAFQKLLGVNLSIPIPIAAGINHGSLDAAQSTFEQTQYSVASVELAVETSVRQAYSQYQLALEQYEQYSADMLSDAKKVRDARLYSYKAGSASLLDVLTAENTLAAVNLAYYNALSGYANALISLEQTTEIWDILN
jgi:cobalt-zinc-cadmium efflux system outer membrane protein